MYVQEYQDLLDVFGKIFGDKLSKSKTGDKAVEFRKLVGTYFYERGLSLKDDVSRDKYFGQIHAEADKLAGAPTSRSGQSTDLIRDLSRGKGSIETAIALYLLILKSSEHQEQLKFIDDELFGKNNTISSVYDFVCHKNIALIENKLDQPHFLLSPEYVENASTISDEISLNALDHNSIRLVGRDNEIARLNDFMQGKSSLYITAVIGSSGAGKTRLVTQWMKTFIQDDDWHAGLVTDRNASEWKTWVPLKNTLIVIDYVYHFDEVIRQIIKGRSRYDDKKVRLILLDHIFPEALDGIINDTVLNPIADSLGKLEARQNLLSIDAPIRLEPIQRDELILQNVISQVSQLGLDDQKIEDGYKQLIKMGPSAQHPLFAALIGQTIKQNLPISSLNRRELIHRYLDTTNRIPWRQPTPKSNKLDEVMGCFVGSFVSASTVRRGADLSDLWKLIPRVSKLETHNLSGEYHQRAIDRCVRIVSSEDRRNLKSFEPDILGENFFFLFLHEIGIREPNRNGDYHKSFMAMISHISQQKSEEDIAVQYVDFARRAARNLANDFIQDSKTHEDWQALIAFLSPDNFKEGSAIRTAVTVALVEIALELDEAKHGQILQVLRSKITLNELFHAHSHDAWRKSVYVYIDHIKYEVSKSQYESDKLLRAIFDVPDGGFQTHSLFYALQLDLDHLFKQLLKLGFDIKHKYLRHQESLLMSAVQSNALKIASLLINLGVDVNYRATGMRDLEQATAFWFACQFGYDDMARLLITNDANLYAKPKFRDSPLIVLLKNHKLQLAHDVIDASSKEEIAGIIGLPALHLAAKLGHLGIVDFLFQSGMTIEKDLELTQGRGLLNTVAREGDAITAAHLIAKGYDPNQISHCGDVSPLLTACETHNIEVIKVLLINKANINRPGKNKIPLATCLESSETVQLLVDAGADVNLTTEGKSCSALYTACRNGFLESAKILIDHDADIDLIDEDTNHSALSAALNYRHLDIVDLLIKCGAKIHHKNSITNQNILHPLCVNNSYLGAEYCERIVELAKLVIGSGIDLEFVETNGMTPLKKCCSNNAYEVAKLLLLTNVDVNFTGANNSDSPLMTLVEYTSNYEFAELLIKYGANTNYISSNGNTALSYLSFTYTEKYPDSNIGRVKIADLIIKNDADINYIVPSTGFTPLMYAVNSEYTDMVSLLLKNSALVKHTGLVNYDAIDIATEKKLYEIENMLLNAIN